MFDETMRELEKYKKGVRIPVTLPLDEKGYFDRLCPSSLCRAYFKVLFEDWKTLVRDEIVFCPICRQEAIASQWNTEEQNEYLDKFGLKYISKVIGNSLKKDAQSFNGRQSKNGFITMSMSYKPGTSPVVIPIEAAEAMEQSFTCESCGCRYASAGAAFFCPACGYNSATSTFDNAMQTVLKLLSTLPKIRESVSKIFNKDAAKDIERQIIEGSFCKIIASFERLAEATFTRLPKAKEFTLRKNVFQNLSESSNLWNQATGKGYKDMLSDSELTDLNRFFQQRHLIIHKESIVDQEYITKSNDNTYLVGQRLVIKEEAVRQLGDLVVKLANHLKTLN